MTSYTLSAESHRWWWLPATAGATGTAAVTAILVVPATGIVAPVEPPPASVVVTDDAAPTRLVDRPCYLARPGWNTPAGWEHPVCTTVLRGRSDDGAPGRSRPAPGYLP